MPTAPDQFDLIIGGLDPAYPHIADQFLVGHDAAHGFAQGGAVHRDVAQHAPGAGLHVTRAMQAEQRVAGDLQQVRQQPFMGFPRNAFAVVGQIRRVYPGGGQRLVDIQAQVLGVAQVFEQVGNRGVAEVVHGLLFCLS